MKRVCPAALLGTLLLASCASALDRARDARDMGELDQAESYYRAALDEPQRDLARRELADLLVERGEALQGPTAIRAYEQALELVPTHDQALTLTVRQLRRQGELGKALERLDAAASTGPCPTCDRLKLVLLLQRGDVAMKAERWDDAIAAYESAQAVHADPGPALNLTLATLHRDGLEAAASRLEASLPLLEGNSSLASNFAALRLDLVARAFKADDPELAARLMAMSIPGESSEDHVRLTLAIAHSLSVAGEHDQALLRYRELLTQADDGDVELSDTQRMAIETRVLTALRLQIARDLSTGSLESANTNLEDALSLRPNDWQFKMQRVLALTPSIGAEAALAALDQVPPSTRGRNIVAAVIQTYAVGKQVARGELEAAEATLERLQVEQPNLPEVHLALAQWLAASPAELSGRERRALRRDALVDYEGPPTRLAEALGELEWAAGESRAKNPRYAFHAPWFRSAAQALEQSIRRTYPYKVAFSPEPETTLVLSNARGSFIDLGLNGPSGFTDAAGLQPGQAHTVTVPEPGVVEIRLNDRDRYTVLAEPYTAIAIPLE